MIAVLKLRISGGHSTAVELMALQHLAISLEVKSSRMGRSSELLTAMYSGDSEASRLKHSSAPIILKDRPKCTRVASSTVLRIAIEITTCDYEANKDAI
jgi:hypothetical protein